MLEGLKLFFVFVFIIDCTKKKDVLSKCMTLAAGFKEYEDYMEYLQNLACGETLFYYHRVNHVLMCERAESCGFFDALFSNMGFFFFSGHRCVH